MHSATRTTPGLDWTLGALQNAPATTQPRRSETLASGRSRSPASGRSGSRRIPVARLLLTINQLAVMVQNGIDLAEALGTAARTARHPGLAETLQRLQTAINNGSSFSAALAAHAEGFPPTMSPLIAAAESTGDVPGALNRISRLLRSEVQLRSSVNGALIYPVILIVVSFTVMTAMVFGVLPQFGEVFSNMGRPVPLLTQWLLDFGQLCRSYWYLGAVALAAMLGGGYHFASHPSLRRVIDGFLLQAPVLREAYRPLSCGRMFRLIGSMVGGGVPMLEAVRLTRDSLRNGYLTQMLEDIEEDILAGSPVSQAMEDVSFLPPEAAQMVRTAERTGRIAEVLNDCGEFYEEQGERMLRRLVHMLEPVIILGMGVVVAGVVLSIMIPLLDISSAAH